jgi:hypothetical protein
MLSKETRLLAEHWDAVEDVFATEQKLRTELTTFMCSLEQDLKQAPWWSAEWHFTKQHDEQVFIAHSQWKGKAGFVLWIGVEQFSARALFGKESGTQLYLWVRDNNALTAALRNMVEEKKVNFPGELSKRPQGYIVRRYIPKCMPTDVGRFEEFVRTPILEFFSACADQEKLLTSVVKQHLKNE